MTSIGFVAKETPQFLAIFGDGLIRELAPHALRLAGLPPVADDLAGLPTVTAAMISRQHPDVEQMVAVCRRAHTAVLAAHRRAVELLGSELCRMTDADLVVCTGAIWWTDPSAWRWPYGPQFGSAAAGLAYSSWIRAIGVLHLWGQAGKARQVGQFLDSFADRMRIRAFLECDDAYLLTPGNPDPSQDVAPAQK